MDRLSARRKLLRGSLSAPLVLTVASPAALARSSFLACITRGDNPQGDPYTADRRTDNLYREQVTVWTIVPPPEAAGPDATPETLYQRIFDGILNLSFVRLDNGVSFKLLSADGYTITEEQRWMLIYFDPETGERVGSGYHPNGGSAASRSCYASFIWQLK
jgi:hypothetical protein